MGLTDPDADRHHRHSMVLVPRDTPGVKVERMLTTMGNFDEPLGHGEVSLHRRPGAGANILSARVEAFAIAQGRLGPGRVHHCMRLIGLAEMALELAIQRGTEPDAFGKPLVNLGGNRERIADARIAIDQARLLVLNAAWKLDTAELAGRPVSSFQAASQHQQPGESMAMRASGDPLAVAAEAGRRLAERGPLQPARRPARAPARPARSAACSGARGRDRAGPGRSRTPHRARR